MWRLKNDHHETAKGRYGISAPEESFSPPAGSSTAMVVPLSELSSTQTEPPWRAAISHTSGLDGQNMRLIAERLKSEAQHGRTILVITHDRELIERCCDNIVEVEKRSS